MTTIAEFLAQTKSDYYIQKRAQGIYAPQANPRTSPYTNPTFGSSPAVSASSTPVKKSVPMPSLETGTADDWSNWALQFPIVQQGVTLAFNTFPNLEGQVHQAIGSNYNIKGIGTGADRYFTMAKRLLGGDEKTNPYLNYFREKGQAGGYSDRQFMYDLSEIMKSNPQTADVIMRNTLAGDTTYADILYGMGTALKESDPKQASEYFNNAQRLYKMRGQLGKTFFGPAMMGSFLASGHTKGVDASLKAMEGNNAAQFVLGRFKDSARRANFDQLADTYNQNIYKPLVQDQYYAQNFYGALNNPAAQNALKYGAPWLAYGVPIAGAMSMIGNNMGWPLVLGGGLLSSAYGGATGAGYLQNFANSPTGQTIDNTVSWFNNPLGRAAGSFRSTAPVGRTLTTPQFGHMGNINNNNGNFNPSAGSNPTNIGPTTAPGATNNGYLYSQTDYDGYEN